MPCFRWVFTAGCVRRPPRRLTRWNGLQGSAVAVGAVQIVTKIPLSRGWGTAVSIPHAPLPPKPRQLWLISPPKSGNPSGLSLLFPGGERLFPTRFSALPRTRHTP